MERAARQRLFCDKLSELRDTLDKSMFMEQEVLSKLTSLCYLKSKALTLEDRNREMATNAGLGIILIISAEVSDALNSEYIKDNSQPISEYFEDESQPYSP
jgi:hypothetical protein